MRRLTTLVGALVLAGAGAAGCVAPPPLDAEWRALAGAPPEERMLFARGRRVQARDAVHTSRVAAGITAAFSAYAGATHLQAARWNRDQHGDATWAKERIAAAALGGLLLTSIAVVWGGYHEAAFEQWGAVGRAEADAAAEFEAREHGPGDDAVPAVSAPPARLYLARGAAVPPDADGLEIVRVSGPDDPRLQELVAALGTLQLPVLRVTGASGPLFVIGPEAVRASLATRRTGR